MRQAGERYTAETEGSTPTVHATPHCVHEAVTPAFTASVRALARRIRRQCRERQAASQNTAVDLADGISRPPHPRQDGGPQESSVITVSFSRGTPSLPMQPPYAASTASGSPTAEVLLSRDVTCLHILNDLGQ